MSHKLSIMLCLAPENKPFAGLAFECIKRFRDLFGFILEKESRDRRVLLQWLKL